MITPNNGNNQDDFFDTDQNDRQQDVNNSDAGKFTEDAEEQAMLETRVNDENPDNGYNTIDAGKQQPLTTQGNAEELAINLGGTSNLSLDQLKKAHHPED